MAISYPTSLDTLTVRSSGDTISEDHMNDVQDICEALEVKVGVDSSAVVTTLDYLVKNSSSSDPGHKHTLANGATNCSTNLANLTDAEVTQLENIGAETISAAQWGYLGGLAATDTEINLACDGISATAAEINNACDLSANNFFGTGRAVYFWEDTAPTGWTLDSTAADCVLAVKGGAQDYNVNGGTKAASSWTALGLTITGHAVTEAEMPSHGHRAYGGGNATSGSAYGFGHAQGDHFAGTELVSPAYYTNGNAGTRLIELTGSGDTHTHASSFDGTWRPPGGVGIIATKDA